MHQPRRRKKRHTHGMKSVEVMRGRNGYGFTISGQHPCILSCIVSGSPADRAGLKTGDYLISVNTTNVSQASHDDVVRMIGSSSGLLVLQIAENFNSDSSDDDFHNKPKSKCPNRVRPRHVLGASKVEELRPTNVLADRSNQQQVPNRYAAHSKRTIHSARSRSHSPGMRDKYSADTARHARDRPTYHHIKSRGIAVGHSTSQGVERKRHKHQAAHSAGIVVNDGARGPKHTVITREARLAPQAQSNWFDSFSTDSSETDPNNSSAFTPRELSNILYPSLEPTLASDSFAEQPRAVREEEVGGSVCRCVVGYVGSIEMPRDVNLPNSRLQSIRSAVRRLRVEQKIHTLVLMEVFEDGVKLTNTAGNTVAHYPSEKVAFSGFSPDDKRFFGIVTLHSPSSDEISSDNSSFDGAYMSSSSCHVFMVNTELAFHVSHAQKARSFGLRCSLDPVTRTCREFPTSAGPILQGVAKLYRGRQDGLYDAELVRGNVGGDADVEHHRSNSNSSNSDSGLGFCTVEDARNSDPVYVVEMPAEQNVENQWGSNGQDEADANLYRAAAEEDLSALAASGPRAASAAPDLCSSTPDQSVLNVSVSSDRSTDDSQNQSTTLDRLNVRAMPDPVGFKRPSVLDALEQQNSADNLRRSMHKILLTRQRQWEYNSSTSDADSSHSQQSSAPSAFTRVNPRSGPLDQRHGASVGNHAQMKLADKLSPRAFLGGPKLGHKGKPTAPIPVSIPEVPDLNPVTTTSSTSVNADPPPVPERKPALPPRNPVHKSRVLPPCPERPKSTPPMLMQKFESKLQKGDEDYDSDPGGQSAVQKLVSVFDEDQWGYELPVDVGADDAAAMRRYSEGHALLAKREKEKEAQLAKEAVKLTKAGSFKEQLLPKSTPLSRRTLSNSHESLVVSDKEFPANKKLGIATSITSITKQVSRVSLNDNNDNSPVGRAASWAVSFDKLLQDKAGLATFTEFLKKEFSEENIVFWIKCEQYKHIQEEDERQAWAAEMFDRHLCPMALEPVNIDSEARQVTERGLEEAAPELFEMAQQQIFQLMKHDSYSRFLKSPLYKQCVVADMEGKPLPFSGDDLSKDKLFKSDKKVTFTNSIWGHHPLFLPGASGTQSMKKSKSSSAAEDNGEEKRRRSLLPWNRKSDKKVQKMLTETDLFKMQKRKDDNDNEEDVVKTQLADLSIMSKEVVSRKDSLGTGDQLVTSHKGIMAENQKFCRVILPDGSTTVVYAKTGQTIRTVLKKLCERRNMTVTAIEVFQLGSEQPLDLSQDISSLGSKEIKVEKRVLFRMDLPNRKSIAVKAKANRSIQDVFKPILHKYGFKMDNMVVQVAGTGVALDQESQVSGIDNQRVVIQTTDDFAEWGGFGSHRLGLGKPPLPKKKEQMKTVDSLENITNQIFKDLLEGTPDTVQYFDELGVLDPDRKHDDKAGDESRNSGIFGFIRRNSIGEKDGSKAKGKHRVTFASQRNVGPKHDRKQHDPEEEKFIDLLSRVQGQRLDDQRGLSTKHLELPDFLKTRDLPQRSKSSVSRSMLREVERNAAFRKSVDAPMYHSDSSLAENNEDIMSRSWSHPDGFMKYSSSLSELEKANTSQSGGVAHMDQSFSQSGVVPTHKQAEKYFSHGQGRPATPDFNQSRIMEKSLGDIGMDADDGRCMKGQVSSTPLSKLPPRLSPRATTPKPEDRQSPSPAPRVRPSSALGLPRPAPRQNSGDQATPTPRPLPRPRSRQASPANTPEEDLDTTLKATSPPQSPEPPPPPQVPRLFLAETDAADFPPPSPLVVGRRTPNYKGANVRFQTSDEDSSRQGSPYQGRSNLLKQWNGEIVDPNEGQRTPTLPRPVPKPRTKLYESSDSTGEVDMDCVPSPPSPSTHDLILVPDSPRDTTPTPAKRSIRQQFNIQQGPENQHGSSVSGSVDSLQVSFV